MSNSNTQGNGHKVAGTQGTITAQNPANQSNEDDKVVIFTEAELEGLAMHYANHNLIKPRFFKDTFRMIDRTLKGARMPQDKKGLIKMGFALLAGIVPPYRPKLEFIAESFYPNEIKGMVEAENSKPEGERDIQYVIEQIEEEMGFCLNDVTFIFELDEYGGNDDGFYDEYISECLAAFDEYEDEFCAAGLEHTEDFSRIYLDLRQKYEDNSEVVTKTHYNQA